MKRSLSSNEKEKFSFEKDEEIVLEPEPDDGGRLNELDDDELDEAGTVDSQPGPVVEQSKRQWAKDGGRERILSSEAEYAISNERNVE